MWQEHAERERQKRQELEDMRGDGQFLVHSHHGVSVLALTPNPSPRTPNPEPLTPKVDDVHGDGQFLIHSHRGFSVRCWIMVQGLGRGVALVPGLGFRSSFVSFSPTTGLRRETMSHSYLAHTSLTPRTPACDAPTHTSHTVGGVGDV